MAACLFRHTSGTYYREHTTSVFPDCGSGVWFDSASELQAAVGNSIADSSIHCTTQWNTNTTWVLDDTSSVYPNCASDYRIFVDTIDDYYRLSELGSTDTETETDSGNTTIIVYAVPDAFDPQTINLTTASEAYGTGFLIVMAPFMALYGVRSLLSMIR